VFDGRQSAEDLFSSGKAYYDAGNYAWALDCFLKAAKTRNADAQYYLGVMYENGTGVAQDRSQFIFWYSKAVAENNHPGALAALKRLQKKG
jgi:TPR repeat protein